MPLKIALKSNSCYKPYFNTTYTTNIFFGGSGSGKSVFMAQKVMLDLIKGDRYLVCRKVAATLKYSCYQEIKTAIINAGLEDYFVFNLAPDLKITCKKNGAFALFKGLDDIEKIKSISGLTKIWVEEASETEASDIDQLRLRLRGSDEITFQIFLTFNPINESSWLNQRYFKQDNPDVFILKTTYLDNVFVGKAYAKTLDQLKITNPAYYRIYALGEWGLIKTGTEFWYNFSRNNVEPTSYNPELPLWLSFDFNVNPYLTCIVAQVHNGKVYILKEVLAKHPNNDTASLCAMVLRDYGQHPTQVFITGDPAGKHQDTRGQANDYTIIQKAFGRLNVRMQVPTSAPSVHRSGTFANGLLATGNIIIGDNCVKLINDLEVVKQGADGGMIKEKVKDKVSKLTIEPHGHLSDALRYLIITIFAKEFNASFATQGGKVYS
jgi:hypothetical protein